jgi:hypothetical protein
MFAIIVRLTEPDQKVKPRGRDGAGAVLEAWAVPIERMRAKPERGRPEAGQIYRRKTPIMLLAKRKRWAMTEMT